MIGSDTPDHIKLLARKWQEGTITEPEKKEFDDWYHSLENIFEMNLSETEAEAERRIYQAILTRGNIAPQRRITLWPRIAAAASIVLIAGTGLFVYLSSKPAKNTDQAVYTNDVSPGKLGATLTLANGRKIRLTDARNGELAKEAGVVISKSEDGQLSYEIKDNSEEPNKTNTLSTANGETYRLRLPDGSFVWLNAASSLTYSANLINDGKRTVTLRGEGYFEITKDKAHPFVVQTTGQQVEVLGTHFNVNAYGDEPAVRTTLLEGSVKVSGNKAQKILKPGEQAANTGSAITVAKADTETVTDWKDGDFIFKGEDFKTAMRRVARWYDVEIVYDPGVQTVVEPGGWISRKSNLSAVLELIEAAGNVHFKIEGRRVRVTK